MESIDHGAWSTRVILSAQHSILVGHAVHMSKGTELRAFTPTLILLLLAVLINYVDRSNLALAAPLLKVEWGLSASQLGILFSTFFWTYMTLQFAVGALVDRLNVNVIMALGFLVWSLSTAATASPLGLAPCWPCAYSLE